jgi:hypothetical protein
MVRCTILGAIDMTLNGVNILDRAVNFTGALALLSGMVLGVAFLVLQSL